MHIQCILYIIHSMNGCDTVSKVCSMMSSDHLGKHVFIYPITVWCPLVAQNVYCMQDAVV